MSELESRDPDSLIDDLLDRWEEAHERGESISAESLCASHPELFDEVRLRIAQLRAIDTRIGKGPLGTGFKSQKLVGVRLPVQSSIEELEFLQRGGLGAVYVGEDMSAHRRVAVKFLHQHLASDPVCRERFRLEAEVTARLEHPGVIPLYGIGETSDGDPFYAMRFIDGQSMDDLVRSLHEHTTETATHRIENDRRYRQLLTHFVSVCQTIAYAHNRGIVHRDIKPANVMLGKYGETIVVDWGLAIPVIRDEPFRQSGEQTLMPALSSDSSTSGHGAGTPVYMSPEQASKLDPTPASDVYSLGATLYKILCGRPPVDGDSFAQIKQRVIDGELTPVREVRPSVPPPLASIAHKALKLKPTDRYATALKMAEDVEAFLADEPVAAHQESWVARWMRVARHHRSATQTALVALVLGSILAGFAFLTLGAYATRETYLRKDAEEAHTITERLRRESMATSAKFLAKSIGNEIDLRWRVLEAEAASPVLRQLILDLNAKIPETPADPNRDAGALLLSALDPERSELQNWLQARYIDNQQAVKSDSWFVQGIEGTQLARVRAGDSIGRNFRHRDYFHGRGHDLDLSTISNDADMPKPLSGRIVHMSAAYESTNTRTLKVSFSVPIYDAEVENYARQRIGVMGMSVELGDFAMDPNTWLIDTRPDQFEKQRGLLLQHPDLGQRSERDELPHLSDAWVTRMLQLRRQRAYPSEMAAPRTLEEMVVEIDDPIRDERALVAMEPVMIRGRSAEVADTGWIVVVSEAE
ncbi:protein kinase domain-containing protein [Novipirellula artificiosorum]|uniref:Serine/threonine-protein kinase PknD n=1 Tax=Novipirellula artificiosorum TaxID=2528016 RepID=A0A5C6CL53_9BACT|nr:protein kinase [Novipirellula artificiosorum]TWU24805.1 Serine/threonine-protein kinase PknD [Novipirellula artificiosorum]